MTTAPFDRSLAQRRDALQRANEIRTKRATLKRDLKSGKVSIHDLLLEPPEYLHSAKVFDLLIAVPAYGRVKTNKVLTLCRVSPSKTVGGLSPRQRTELASMLRRTLPAPRNPGSTTPETQYMSALASANTVRLDRADIKHQVATGARSVIDIVRDRPAAARTMTIAQLLSSQHRWGRTRTRRFLASLPMMETKTLGTMSARQRREIISRLDSGYEEVVRPPATPAERVLAHRVPSAVADMETYRAKNTTCLHRANPGSLYTLCGLEPEHTGMRLIADREWDGRGANRCGICTRSMLARAA